MDLQEWADVQEWVDLLVVCKGFQMLRPQAQIMVGHRQVGLLQCHTITVAVIAGEIWVLVILAPNSHKIPMQVLRKVTED